MAIGGKVMLGGATILAEICKKLRKFLKISGKVCANDFDHLEATYK